MSAKLAVAALLLLAVLAKSSASESDLTVHKNNHTGFRCTNTPGFIFYRKRFGKVQFASGLGTIINYESVINTTQWFPIVGNDSFLITQNVSFPVLTAIFNYTAATFGPYKSLGEADADLGANTFNLTINATATMDSRPEGCRFKLTLKPLESETPILEMDLDDLGIPGKLITRSRSLLKGLANTVAESLKGILQARLACLLEDILAEKVSIYGLCTQLLASNVTHFPEPNFD